MEMLTLDQLRLQSKASYRMTDTDEDAGYKSTENVKLPKSNWRNLKVKYFSEVLDQNFGALSKWVYMKMHLCNQSIN